MVLGLRKNWEFWFLLRQHQWPNCFHVNGIKGVIVFLLLSTFMVLSFKNTASIFPEISFIQYFTILVANNMTHYWSNLHNRKTSISLKRKKIFQKEKCHSSVFWKAFQISRKYFSCLMNSDVNIVNVALLLFARWRRQSCLTGRCRL